MKALILDGLPRVPIASVRLDPRNARKHPKDNLAALKKSLETYGQRKPIVCNADGVIEAGNGLYLAAKALGWTEIAAVRVDDTAEMAKAYALMDNQSALLSEWDMPTLKDLLQELDAGAFDMELTGFSPASIEDLMNQTFTPGTGLTEDDTVPEEVETVCKTGDLWQLGENRLLCGDATKIEDLSKLMGGEKADMVFTDPPFDLEETDFMDRALSVTTGAILVMHSDANMVDLVARFRDHFRYFLVHYYSFGFARSQSAPQLAHHLLGVFGPPSFQNCKDGFKTVIAEQLERDKLMPYQKRVAIPEQCIRHFSVGGLVLDLFGGSGSTLIACEKLQRKCLMMEIDPHYCDVIIKRWEDFTGNKAKSTNRRTK